MVLFYRQGESIADVSAALELTEATVRQRLSRGRALLREGLTAVVESALTRSRPGIGFTVAVLAALPALTTPPSATAAALSGTASAQGSGAIKAAVASIGSWAIIGPAIGFVVGMLSTRAAGVVDGTLGAGTQSDPAPRAAHGDLLLADERRPRAGPEPGR